MNIYPLSIAKENSIFTIQKINTKNEKIKRFLLNLGFVEGEKISIVSFVNHNLIIKIKDSRVALDKSIASKIFVS